MISDNRRAMNAAVIPLNMRLLERVLRLPSRAIIEAMSVDPRQPDVLLLRVTDATLPVVREGEVIPLVNLIMYGDDHEQRLSEYSP